MPPEPPVGDPRWWLHLLNEALVLRWTRMRMYQRYYEGEHRLLFAGEKFRNAFGSLFAEFADNWCDLVVDAVVERLTVQGFRMDADSKNDDDAWDIWQANNLDADSEVAHTEALICGESYALVEPQPDQPYPAVHIEHASQVIVAMSPGDRRRRAAALKRWVDDDGNLRANVYLPDMVWKYVARGDGMVFQGWVLAGTTSPAAVELHWEPYTVDGEEQHVANPLGLVPVVPLRNKPRLLTVSESELKKVIPIQDAVNKLVLDMMVSSEAAAFPQRWVTGLPLKLDPETQKVVPPFDAAVTKIFQAEDPLAKFGAMPAADLTNYIKAIEMLVMHVAAQTRTPPHYFTAFSGQFPSGESIQSAETGLVNKARQRARHFGEGWEEVMRLCFKATGDKRADAVSAETIWADHQFRSEGVHMDALIKQKALNIPDEVLWEKAGYSPQEIERIKQIQAADIAAGEPPEILAVPTVKKAPVVVEP